MTFLSEYPRKVPLLWNEAVLRDLIDVISVQLPCDPDVPAVSRD